MYRTGTRLPKYRYIIKLIPKLTYCYLARQLIAGIFFTEVWSQKEHNSTWFYLLFKYDMPNLRFVCRYFQKLTQIQRYRNPVAHWGSLCAVPVCRISACLTSSWPPPQPTLACFFMDCLTMILVLSISSSICGRMPRCSLLFRNTTPPGEMLIWSRRALK